MGLPELEIDHVLLKRWLKLFGLRVAVLAAHFIAIADGLGSVGRYPLLLKCAKGGSCPLLKQPAPPPSVGNTTAKPVTVLPITRPKKGPKIGPCSMAGGYDKDFDGHMFDFNMAFFVLLGFYGLAFINFIIKSVINFRLVLCPVPQDKDACGNLLPTIWHKIRDATFNFATFPCDTIIMSCIIGVYASKRTATGLGCWECFADPFCTEEEHYDSILFMSSFAMNLNMFLVLIMVFYKGFITYFRATDPEKCDCHCVVPRCITGCFISLITTSVIMMPPFVTLSNKYYALVGEDGQNLFSMLMENMKMIGMIIWVVIGAVAVVVLPIKLIMLKRGGGGKK